MINFIIISLEMILFLKIIDRVLKKKNKSKVSKFIIIDNMENISK